MPDTMRHFMEVIREAVEPTVGAFNSNLIYRWVDEKGAKSYLRSNAMVARWRHFLPAKLTGLFHSKFQTGLSFAKNDQNWSMAGSTCFIVDREKLDLPSYDINGQAIYVLSDLMGLIKMGGGGSVTREQLESARKHALEDSAKDPDEVFVVGSIRDLSSTLAGIMYRDTDNRTLDALTAYCEAHRIPLKSV